MTTKPIPNSPFTRPLSYFHEVYPDNETHFIRLYDKYYFPMEGIWLFGVAQFKEETPEQLKEMLGLPFVPLYICEVFVEAHQRVTTNIISKTDMPSKSGEFVCMVEDGLRFENERLLKPNISIRQQLGNEPT